MNLKRGEHHLCCFVGILLAVVDVAGCGWVVVCDNVNAVVLAEEGIQGGGGGDGAS
jgi:hypothetical protein